MRLRCLSCFCNSFSVNFHLSRLFAKPYEIISRLHGISHGEMRFDLIFLIVNKEIGYSVKKKEKTLQITKISKDVTQR